MTRTYKAYTDKDVIEGAKTVKSIAGLLRHLGLREAGGNYAHLKKTLQRLCINTDHWTGQAWNKNEKLKDWQDYHKSSSVKRQLSKEISKCECCGINSWLNQPIKLELHHIDGDRTNNNRENFKLLCPNCHSYTDNFRKAKSAIKSISAP